MKKQSLYLSLLLAVLALALPSCNDDVFIKPLVVSAETGEMGPDNKTLFIDISGSDWTLDNVWYYDDEKSVQGILDNGTYRINTVFSELSIQIKPAGVEVQLESYLGKETAILSFTVTDGYEYHSVNIDVHPTGTYDIEIESVEYVFDQWRGYPDEDFHKKVLSYNYPEGLVEPITLEFPTPKSAPMIYKFEPRAEADVFARQVLNSGIVVPIPTYGPFTDDHLNFWVMAGQEVKLTTGREEIRTTFLPKVPAPIELPADKPLSVSLFCFYESIGLHCTIKAKNPTTGQSETIKCELRLIMPKEFSAKLDYL